MAEKVCIVYHDILTAYGHGTACCMDTLFQNRTKFRKMTRFHSDGEIPAVAACFPEELFSGDTQYIAETSVKYLLDQVPAGKEYLSGNAALFFALTQGEIHKLDNPEKIWTAQILAKEIQKYLNRDSGFRIFSASCASGNIALARAAAEIEAARMDHAIVIGCDVVSEFTYAGFSSVHAITQTVCRPYDISHNGLLLGDAAGIIVLASEKKARQNNWKILATVSGYGLTTDSYHAAAPDPEGIQMKNAIKKVLKKNSGGKLAGVIGHGTGTALNDNMEIAALTKIFPQGIPLASVKGGIGHILAASGLVQASCAIECLERGKMFPQTSLQTPQEGAENFVSEEAQSLSGDTILSLNAGFGGLNAVIGIRRA